MKENKLATKFSKRRYPIIIVVLAVMLVAVFIDRTIHVRNEEKLISALDISEFEKDSINKELTDLFSEYEYLRNNNDSLNVELEVEQEKVKNLMNDLKVVKRNNAVQIALLRKETKSLRKVMKGYIHQLDSLNTLNQELTEEVRQIKTDYQLSQDKNKELKKRNINLSHTVARATAVKALGIEAGGINKKGKFTKKIAKTAQLKTSFTLSENQMARSGKRKLYIRIARPDDYVIAASKKDLFLYEGKRIAFSGMREVEYKGKQMEVNIYCPTIEGLIPGTYYVDIYDKGEKIGTSTFELK